MDGWTTSGYVTAEGEVLLRGTDRLWLSEHLAALGNQELLITVTVMSVGQPEWVAQTARQLEGGGWRRRGAMAVARRTLPEFAATPPAATAVQRAAVALVEATVGPTYQLAPPTKPQRHPWRRGLKAEPYATPAPPQEQDA